ncbi:LamB/YcsF family protein, partial [Campylobacter coli]|uniref:LamB/YcsF family protein n=1 Tax=Campylobacter coli TaxID=195 RepID=UPI0038292FFF
MFKVDLNSDLGESIGVYKMGMDEEILKFVRSANVACGFHAGDPCVMDTTLALSKQNKVCNGAHPPYPELLAFGGLTQHAVSYTNLTLPPIINSED